MKKVSHNTAVLADQINTRLGISVVSLHESDERCFEMILFPMSAWYLSHTPHEYCSEMYMVLIYLWSTTHSLHCLQYLYKNFNLLKQMESKYYKHFLIIQKQ